MWLEKDDEFNKQSAQIFSAVIGQCTFAMRNKLESFEKFAQLKEDDDAIGLLDVIKELTFTNTSAQCKY